jgi:SH3-like domain-containing protein
MSQDVLGDWIASLLSIHSNREIAKFVHVGRDRVRAGPAAQADHTRIFHHMGLPTKVTFQIKQAMIEQTL